MKIMLVDDSKAIIALQRKILSKLGFEEVCEASNGGEALALYEQQKPDLTFIDINLPGMDGITLLRAIRDRDAETCIIMCTAEADRKLVAAAMEAGANDYLIKPFSRESLAAKLRDVGVAAN